jgi:vacuolar-type H+-ATPase subunit F/Vma7
MNKKSARVGRVLALMSNPRVARFITRARGKFRKRLRNEARREYALILLASAAGEGDVADGYRAIARRWHGSIKERARNVDGFVTFVLSRPSLPYPPELFPRLSVLRDKIMELIHKCELPTGSLADRGARDEALDEAVSLCTGRGQTWALEMQATGSLTVDEIHQLGFSLLGERGGYHARTEPTLEKALVKVEVKNDDFVSVVVDQSAGENAARVVRGWPRGVKHILIVITAADGTTEIYRQMSTHQHNQIEMPAGSHGKQFIAKAAFLKHVDDTPHFGNQEVFSMPYTTEDLASGHARLEREKDEEIERLKAELKRREEEEKNKQG